MKKHVSPHSYMGGTRERHTYLRQYSTFSAKTVFKSSASRSVLQMQRKNCRKVPDPPTSPHFEGNDFARAVYHGSAYGGRRIRSGIGPENERRSWCNTKAGRTDVIPPCGAASRIWQRSPFVQSKALVRSNIHLDDQMSSSARTIGCLDQHANLLYP